MSLFGITLLIDIFIATLAGWITNELLSYKELSIKATIAITAIIGIIGAIIGSLILLSIKSFTGAIIVSFITFIVAIFIVYFLKKYLNSKK